MPANAIAAPVPAPGPSPAANASAKAPAAGDVFAVLVGLVGEDSAEETPVQARPAPKTKAAKSDEGAHADRPVAEAPAQESKPVEAGAEPATDPTAAVVVPIPQAAPQPLDAASAPVAQDLAIVENTSGKPTIAADAGESVDPALSALSADAAGAGAGPPPVARAAAAPPQPAPTVSAAYEPPPAAATPAVPVETVTAVPAEAAPAMVEEVVAAQAQAPAAALAQPVAKSAAKDGAKTADSAKEASEGKGQSSVAAQTASAAKPGPAAAPPPQSGLDGEEAAMVEVGSTAPADAAPADAEAPAPAQTSNAAPQASGAAGAVVSGQPHAIATPGTVAHLAAQMVRRLDGKASRFDIQLDPLGLGRVNVSLQIDARGRLSASMAFEHAESAEQMRGRSGELRQALEQAGFDLSGRGLSFETDLERRSGRNFEGQDQAGAQGRDKAFGAVAKTLGEADQEVAPNLQRRSMSGLDIRI